MERGGKDEVKICTRDETCRSGSSQKMRTANSRWSDVWDESVTVAWPSPKTTQAFSSSFNFGVEEMNRMSCSVSNLIWLKKAISSFLS